MKKIILAPDSFKGTMSALDIRNIMRKAALRSFPSCEVIRIPVADGGEGYYVQGVHKDTVPALAWELLGGTEK